MAECYAAMPSYTYALKAEKLLKARGYQAEVRRREKTSSAGCGYSLYIGHNCPQALEILRKNAIPFKGLSGGG